MNDDGLTEDLVLRLAEAIDESCMPRKYAATFCGVSPKTFERWVRAGETGSGSALHVELARMVNQAEAQKVGTSMRNLHALGTMDPAAATSFLKLFKPADFGGPKRQTDEWDSSERAAEKRKKLLASPPPRMLSELAAHGWWQFPWQLEPEDLAALEAIQSKYRDAPRLGA